MAGDPPRYAVGVTASPSLVIPRRRCLAELRASLVSVFAAPGIDAGRPVGRTRTLRQGLAKTALNLLG